MTSGNTSNTNKVVEHAAKFLKFFLTDKEIDKNTRIIIGRVVDFELRNLNKRDHGLKQKVYEIVDGIARYNQLP